MTMDDLYPRLVVESLLARKQLAQTFESAATSEFSPVNDLTLGTALQKNAGKDETSIRDRVRSKEFSSSNKQRDICEAAWHDETRHQLCKGF
jgi:hypothetical protein